MILFGKKSNDSDN